MRESLLEHTSDVSIPVIPVREESFSQWLEQQDEPLKRWVTTTGFDAKPGTLCLVPGKEREFSGVIAGIAAPEDPYTYAHLPGSLPSGSYHIKADWPLATMERVAIGWGLGAYQFTRYKEADRTMARLVMDSTWDVVNIKNQVETIYLVRDLINTPAEDMMPEHLADAVTALARDFDAHVKQVVGDELLRQNLPAIHAVGRASKHAPRLIELGRGDPAHPKLTLVGKGVCFDSGGLDLKPATGMRLMKKDMGGAAHAIGLARMAMTVELPIRLRVLVAAVENAVSGNALRPGDVLRSRKGLTIEIDNTDAEGRVILGDALAEAGADNPDLMIDFATLTGAARSALGVDLPALFSNSEALADGLLEASKDVYDPFWRLPLHKPYRELLDSKVADIANASASPYAGAITAALFLQEFVPEATPWAHFDLMAWNTQARPGRPEGGEAMGLRGVFEYLRRRFLV